MKRWSSQSAFCGPARSQPIIQAPSRKPCTLGPGSDAMSFTVEGQVASVPPIPSLLSPRCPSAVVGRVALIVIDPLDGVTWRRPATHVGQEGLERVVPTGAHGNPPSAIPRELGVTRIGTSITQLSPCEELSRCCVIPRIAVRRSTVETARDSAVPGFTRTGSHNGERGAAMSTNQEGAWRILPGHREAPLRGVALPVVSATRGLSRTLILPCTAS